MSLVSASRTINVSLALAPFGLLGLFIEIALTEDDIASAVILSAVPLFPLALALVLRAIEGREPYLHWLAAALIFIQCANFRIRELSDKTLDWQVTLKLVNLLLFFVVVLPAVLDAHFRLRKSTLLWLIFIVYLISSSFYAISPPYAFVASISNLAAFLLLMRIDQSTGRDGVAALLGDTSLLLALASVLAYFLVPSLGRMYDWVDGALVATTRLQGVMGAPNAVGAGAAFGILLTLFSPLRWSRPLKLFAMLTFLFCLMLSDNRMAMACTLLAIGTVYLLKGNVPVRASLAILTIAVTFLLFDAFSDDILSFLARSGSPDEVLSATGRTQIWGVVLDLWSERPIFGYGYSSSQSLLPTDPSLFKAAAHTHNMYLEVLFSVGLTGFILFALSIITSLRTAIHRKDDPIIAGLVFFLAYGMTEPIFSSFASLPSIGFLSLIVSGSSAPKS